MKLITFTCLMMFTTLFFSVNNVLAQQTTTTNTVPVVPEPVKQEIQEQAKETVSAQTLPMDLTTITGILGTAGGLLWKDRKDKQDLEKQLKECMDILMNYVVCDAKVHNAAMMYPQKTHSQLLQLKATNNAMDNQTISGEMAVQLNRLQKFLLFNFQLPMPNMSIPSPQVINSTTSVQANKVAVPPEDKLKQPDPTPPPSPPPPPPST